jgi:hypothetical protein
MDACSKTIKKIYTNIIRKKEKENNNRNEIKATSFLLFESKVESNKI